MPKTPEVNQSRIIAELNRHAAVPGSTESCLENSLASLGETDRILTSIREKTIRVVPPLEDWRIKTYRSQALRDLTLLRQGMEIQQPAETDSIDTLHLSLQADA